MTSFHLVSHVGSCPQGTGFIKHLFNTFIKNEEFNKYSEFNSEYNNILIHINTFKDIKTSYVERLAGKTPSSLLTVL